LAGIFEDLPNSSMEIDDFKIIEMIIARKCIKKIRKIKKITMPRICNIF
jgi:hypothetical protein